MSPLRVGLDARLYGRGLGIATYIDGLAKALALRADIDAFLRQSVDEGGSDAPGADARLLDLVNRARARRSEPVLGVAEPLYGTPPGGDTGQSAIPPLHLSI